MRGDHREEFGNGMFDILSVDVAVFAFVCRLFDKGSL